VDWGGKQVPVKGVVSIKCFCAERLVVERQHRDPALPLFSLAFLFAVSPHEPLYDVNYDANDKDYRTQGKNGIYGACKMYINDGP
jgi:hypothetical protein